MTKHQLKIGLKVVDRWFPEYGIGEIKVILKTRVKIQFPDEIRTYDFVHLYFLDIFK